MILSNNTREVIVIFLPTKYPVPGLTYSSAHLLLSYYYIYKNKLVLSFFKMLNSGWMILDPKINGLSLYGLLY